MLNWYAIGGIAGLAFLVFWVWIVIEGVNAPLVDDEGRMISEPSHSAPI